MRGEPTAGELQALAARQQQQLDTQARLIAAREQRLRQVYCYRVRLNGGLLIVCNAILKRRRRKKISLMEKVGSLRLFPTVIFMGLIVSRGACRWKRTRMSNHIRS